MTPREPASNDGALAPVAGEGEEPMFSRPTDTSPFGKCDRSIDVSMPEALKDLLSRLGALEGKPVATYARKVLEDHALREQEKVKRILSVFSSDTHRENPR